MTTLASVEPTEAAAPRRKKRLGFNTRVSFPTGEAARGLREGIELFQAAEALGYQSGWAYQRHFDNYLSSPLPFFAAAGQHTTTITLGSAVIPMRYQDPILLAEAAGTADLLTGGRLQLAFSSGTDLWDGVFGGVATDARTEGQRRLARFLAGVGGETIHTVTEQRGPAGPPAGTELTVTPHSPGLRGRIWYGSGHIASAVQAARQGLRLITGTILHEVTDESFPEYQARLIGEYRGGGGGPPPPPPPPRRAAAPPGGRARPPTARPRRRWRSPRRCCRGRRPSCAPPTRPTTWNGAPRGRPRPGRRGPWHRPSRPTSPGAS
nr:LLM class flavin-dependent oxidoreductase [Frankia sp. AgB1.8]